MPAVARKDDSVLSVDGTGYKCRAPMKTSVGEVNDKKVFADGILGTFWLRSNSRTVPAGDNENATFFLL
jgi:hypothetical protein